MKISYNWLKWYIDGELPAPEKLEDILTFKLCEVEGIEKLDDGDSILDLNILPNRAHDLLSHQGVAREIAGLLGFKFKDPIELYKLPEIKETKLKIDIQTPACRRYMGRVVRGIKVGPSPEWVIKHLESIGQRSINNIVDATNIVMYDCGNPCHAFDAKIIPDLEIKITNAKEGEEFPVLGRDAVVAKLKNSDAVIADIQGNTLAIAGVKGGLKSGVNEGTTDIILEVANFDPVAVRKTARRLNLLSDSAKRFENDLSPEHAEYAMRELSATILEMCPNAVFEEIVDVYPKESKPHFIEFETVWINQYLGTDISESEITELLQKYGYEISGENGIYNLIVPYLRLDLVGPHDVAEEVARLYGLDKIQAVPLSLSGKPKVNETFAKILAAKEKLNVLGYRETITYAFRKKGVYEVARGVGDKGALRTNITDGLKESHELNNHNAPLFGTEDVKLFEIGAVFPKEGEITHVAWIDKKGVTEMTLDEFVENSKLQFTNYALDKSTADQKFIQWSLFPFIIRDIAVWVPQGVQPKELADIYKKFGTILLIRDPQFFDEFTKDGKTSYAFRLVFQAQGRTLTDEEVNTVMQTIEDEIHRQGDWQIR